MSGKLKFTALGGVLAFLLGLFMKRRSRSAGPGGPSGSSSRVRDGLDKEARREASEASERREAADDAAIKDIGGRQYTSDAVADLAARLDPTGRKRAQRK